MSPECLAASASAFLITAPSQPWSAAGAEKPTFTRVEVLQDAVLPLPVPLPPGAWDDVWEASWHAPSTIDSAAIAATVRANRMSVPPRIAPALTRANPLVV